MYVEVIKDRVPILGERGARREVPDAEGSVHVALGNVKRVEREQPTATTKKRPRRVYRRRDLRAETAEAAEKVEVDEAPAEPTADETTADPD